jgi:integrase
MPRLVIDLGFLKVSASYIQARKRGRLYYYRRVPEDLRHHFGGKALKYVSLKTTDMADALRKVGPLARADDVLWASLRSTEAQAQGLTTADNTLAGRALLASLGLSEGAGAPLDDEASPQAQLARIDAIDVLLEHLQERHGPEYKLARDREYRGEAGSPSASFLTASEQEASRLLTSDPGRPRVLLSEALAVYLRDKNHKNRHKFEANSRLYVGKVASIVGDLPLDAYTREHARQVRDKLIEDGLTVSSTRRNLNGINAVINHAIKEFGLSGVTNHFKGLLTDRRGEAPKQKTPFTPKELKQIAEACKDRNDDIRHIVAILSDTASRIAEIVGLRREDIFLDHAVPHIFIRQHLERGRTLKNDRNSTRRVPLVGMALWGAQEALKKSKDDPQGWLFPRYAADNNIRNDGASGAVNKWIKESLKIPKTSHAFRHTMKDRLVRVEAPSAVIDAIGGWKDQQSMASAYGQGPMLDQLKAWLDKVVL